MRADEIRDDAAHVFGYLRGLMDYLEHDSTTDEALDSARRAFEAAQRIHVVAQNEARVSDPFVFGLHGDDEVASIRKLAVSKGWFEVPAGSWEKLRMIDGTTGNHLMIYFGKRGLKAVANAGHPAAQALLREWKKAR